MMQKKVIHSGTLCYTLWGPNNVCTRLHEQAHAHHSLSLSRYLSL